MPHPEDDQRDHLKSWPTLPTTRQWLAFADPNTNTPLAPMLDLGLSGPQRVALTDSSAASNSGHCCWAP